MHISFIIPAYNEQSLIGQTLDAIAQATCECAAMMSGHEIIVVNDASSDRTAEIARGRGAKVIDVEKRQIAATRNAGAKVARGDVLIFVDADTIVPAPALRAAIRALRMGAVGGGSAVRMDGELSFLGRLYMALFMLVWRPLNFAAGCFVFCRREAFEAVGGFDERYFASEEVGLSLAMKRQGRFVVVHDYVISSGRKVRMYSGVQLFSLALRLMWKGPKGCQTREGLELWYDGQREETAPRRV